MAGGKWFEDNLACFMLVRNGLPRRLELAGLYQCVTMDVLIPNVCLSFQHFISQREEFETARDSILVWLTEMDLQLTNIEHFSECDVQAKIKQLKVMSQLFCRLSVCTDTEKGNSLV